MYIRMLVHEAHGLGGVFEYKISPENEEADLRKKAAFFDKLDAQLRDNDVESIEVYISR